MTLLVLVALPVQAQESSPPPISLETNPVTLIEGTLAWLRVRATAGGTITAVEAAGEPLHLERLPDGTLQALMGVPLESGDSVSVSISIKRSGEIDTISTSLPVRSGNYPSELLSVPPAYAQPDSATTVRIQTEIARSREISRESQTRRRLWMGPFQLPRRSRITSRFGTARIYNGEVQSRHMGTDFAGVVGAPVHAAGRGLVALVADFYLAGRAVYIDHGAGLVTGYFHLSRIDVRKGQRVVAGQRVGAVGRTGRVTGPHLHWIARYGAISLDPMSLLTLPQAAIPSAGKNHGSDSQGDQVTALP